MPLLSEACPVISNVLPLASVPNLLYVAPAPLRTVRGSDFVVTVPFKLVVGVTVVLSELEEPVELVLT